MKTKNLPHLATLFIILLAILLPVAVMAAIPAAGACPAGHDCSTGIPVPLPRFGIGATVGCILFGPACQDTATEVIIALIDLILWIAGIIAVLFLIIGGLRYITAHGNEEQAEGAKKTITHAIIGLAIIILSFVIVRVISNALITGST